jgi:Fic family protein
MRTFNYSFLETIMLPAKFINAIGSIYELRERMNWRKTQPKFDEKFTDLETSVKIKSIQYSCVPDSAELKDEYINALVGGGITSAQKDKFKAGLAGYNDALDLIRAEYNTLDIRRDDLSLIHTTLWKYYYYSADVGEYRKSEIADKEGQITVRYKVPLPEIVNAMEQLERAYIDARRNDNISRLLLIPCVVLDFLCIRPFDKDSNDRMAMLLSLLLLYKNKFDVVRYISLEERIYRNQPMYHQTVNASMTNIDSKDSERYLPFMELFITMVLSCYTETDRQFPKINDSRLSTVQQIENIVNNSPMPISKHKINDMLPHISNTTVEQYLGTLVRARRIAKVGKARNTKYEKIK